METALGIKYNPQGKNRGNRALVRYADDFVVLCESKENAEQVVNTLKEWLRIRGLALSEDKTSITHLTEGFDFLGFNIRQYSNVRHRNGTVRLITPSKEAIRRHREKIRDEWRDLTGKPVGKVVSTLTPKIKGWANYYRHQVASKAF
jgi:RNA-directed DNA polymerase